MFIVDRVTNIPPLQQALEAVPGMMISTFRVAVN
jgi:hypothetical protein